MRNQSRLIGLHGLYCCRYNVIANYLFPEAESLAVIRLSLHAVRP
jgi:hypothetical protein